MLYIGHRRLLVVVGCTFAILAAIATFSGHLRSNLDLDRLLSLTHGRPATGRDGKQQSLWHGLDSNRPWKSPAPSNGTPSSIANAGPATHHTVYSNTTADGKYFLIDFGAYEGMNANIIPHPKLSETWFVVAQRYKSEQENHLWFTELVCEATFRDKTLKCIKPPMMLPIAGTHSSMCHGDIDHFDLNVGPHDARVFNGPKWPYIIYGSQSKNACFGQWIHDFRLLVDWADFPPVNELFGVATDLERPPPHGVVQKNYFAFWDLKGEMYLHHDVAPKRVYAKLEADGSVSDDLAPLAHAKDEACWQKHLAGEHPKYKSIHQATNSLSITMCNRSELCVETEDNTFIMHIFQHKSYENWHSAYEPYVMLFKATSPFEISAISHKPIWISGRGAPGEKGAPKSVPNNNHWNETEMVYVTSMSWKAAKQHYHGYLDDVLFLGFGVEDQQAGGIDVVAADLLHGLDFCSGP